MFGLGAGELLVIFILALIFIGPKKLPELAKGLGKGIREFNKTKDGIMDQINNPETDQISTDNKTNNIAQSENIKNDNIKSDSSKEINLESNKENNNKV